MTTTPAPTDIDTLKAAIEAVEHLTSMMATNSRDWGAARDDAWFYGIAVGWGPDGDSESEDALPELAARHGWTPETQDRLRKLRAGYAAVPALLDELAEARRERDVYRYEVGHADAEREEAERNRDAAREELAKTAALLERAQNELNAYRRGDLPHVVLEEVRRLDSERTAELAKTRAELKTAREVALSNKNAHQTAFEECERLTAELKRAEQRARMASQHARNCDAQVADADAEVARLQSWLADERAKWLRHQAEDHPVDAEANPATTAEPADEPKDELCSDKNGFHDGHDWTPDPCEPYRWCPGYPVPATR